MSDPRALALAPFVSAAANGDPAAFERLVQETKGVVCAITLATVRDVPMSEDVAQDVYLEAWKGIGRLRNPTSFLPWLRQLARNRSRLALRAAIRRRQRVSHDAHDDLLAAAADPSDNALDSLVVAEEREQLLHALDSLPVASREVLILYYREGGSVRQVSDLLGITDDAVKQRLSRARDRVRSIMLEDAGHALSRTAPGAAFVTAVAGALAAATPGVAAAATLSAGKAAAASGMFAKTGASSAAGASAGIIGGLIGGLTAVFSGARALMHQARDNDERRGIRTYAAAGTMLMVAFFVAVAFMPSPIVMTAVFLVVFTGMCLLTLVYLPRVTARRKAVELRQDPASIERQHREKRMAYLGAVAGLVLGGLPVVLYWFIR